MKRNNGYLDLNAYFKEVKDRNGWPNYMLLAKGIIEQSTYDDRQYWVEINGEKYYFKPSNFPFDELLGFYIAEFLGLNATPYDLAEMENMEHKTVKGVISKSYKKKDAKYLKFYELLEEYYKNDSETINNMGLSDDWQKYYEGPYYMDMSNLEIIWQALEFRYKNRKEVNIAALMDNIVDNYIFSILTRANDKGPQNWEIEESSEGVNICPIADNELIFYDTVTMTYSVDFNDIEKDIKESVKRFLMFSTDKHLKQFLRLFRTFNFDTLLLIIKKVEEQIGISIPDEVKSRYITNFKLNQREISDAINEVIEEFYYQKNKGR